MVVLLRTKRSAQRESEGMGASAHAFLRKVVVVRRVRLQVCVHTQ